MMVLRGVKITPAGEVFEFLLEAGKTSCDTGRYIFEHYLHKPFDYQGGPSTFHSMRKKGKGNDRDLTVWYCSVPLHTLAPLNQMASNLFKMQLYGDVLLVQQSREQSFLPRERYISFTKSQYEEQFVKKRLHPVSSRDHHQAVRGRLQQRICSCFTLLMRWWRTGKKR